MQSISSAWVKTTFEGWHAWPDAPAHRAYLRATHRHLFHVTVGLRVMHDDREVEFHDLQDCVRVCLPSPQLGAQSCEMIAKAIWEGVSARFPGRSGFVEVSEDGEVGATVNFFILSEET